jgi:hypothetical protein
LEIWCKKGHKVGQFIWLATTWYLWRLRNNIIFRGDFSNLLILVDQIMYILRFWFVCRTVINISYGYVDWCNKSLICLHSIASKDVFEL